MYLWGLDAAYREAARAKGVRIMANARVERAKWADRHWQLETRVGVVVAGVVVNAAGAWADEVAIRAGASPLGIQPYRRSGRWSDSRAATPPRLAARKRAPQPRRQGSRRRRQRR